MTTALTETELHKLSDLEKAIERGKQTFVEVGLALQAIRDGRLYRKDYETFEGYCQGRWGWTGRRSNQLINAASVVQALPQDLGTVVPNEGTAREVAKLPQEQRADVVRAAVKAGTVTAAGIRKYGPPPSVPASYGPPPTAPEPATPPPPPTEPSAPEPVKDKIGRPIPEHLVPLWDRAREVQDGLTAISRVKCALEESQDQDDPLYAEVNHSATIAALNQAYTSLKTALPYTVCPSCQGAEQVSKSCRLCKGRGFVSEFRWDRAVPKETKTLILNTIAKGRWDKLKAQA